MSLVETPANVARTTDRFNRLRLSRQLPQNDNSHDYINIMSPNGRHDMPLFILGKFDDLVGVILSFMANFLVEWSNQ